MAFKHRGPLAGLRLFFVVVSVVAITSLAAPVRAADQLEVLFLGDSGPHQPAARFAELEPALEAKQIAIKYTEDLQALQAENLQQYAVLVVYANIDTIDDQYAQAILEYVRGGGGLVALHSASFCFRNQPELVALIGGQFRTHGTGVFRTELASVDHPILDGFGGFESWDETYVHSKHNEEARTVLEYRATPEGREPYTWVRTAGEGRVFYTAWGHDQRTWTNPGFVNLVERGIRFAAGEDPTAAGSAMRERPFPVPEMTPAAGSDTDFQYADVGKQIPNYTPSKQWGTQGEPLSLMQQPLDPQKSMKHAVVPEGFHLELFASEPDLAGKPICMAWDDRGRLWVAETYDYPNELQPPGQGRDRIRICEDTNGDFQADKFTVFAETLSIPTSIAFTAGGVLVQNGTETLLLTDTDGDDVADQRRTVVTGWELGDTHGGVSNFQYGLDNWIWAMQGYNDSQPVAGGKEQGRFRMGFFRMKPDASEIEFIRSTNNNTWGLGISEEGLIFGSTANGNPSIYMPIANRYYERVAGWTPSLTLSSIADTNEFDPITDKVRQVDHHGGYTAGAGHAIYTARNYPMEYWNRTAFVCGPTGHLVGTFILKQDGSDFHSTSPFNLYASDDEWSAPIMAEVGPDGNVWIIDWYNYIVQHNPTPQGFETGRGKAYETSLRDKRYGRIYRVVPDNSQAPVMANLGSADESQLVQALANPTMLVRNHAQRLLVQRGEVSAETIEALVTHVRNRSTDAIGMNVAAIHSLWTLHGLGLIEPANGEVWSAVLAALEHPSAGVRRNAVDVLPNTDAGLAAIGDSDIAFDQEPLVRLPVILKLSDIGQASGGESKIILTQTTGGVRPAGQPPKAAAADSDTAGKLMVAAINDPRNLSDRWIGDAIISAAAMNAESFLIRLPEVQLAAMPQRHERQLEIVQTVAEHYARRFGHGRVGVILTNLRSADPEVASAVLEGFNSGWPANAAVTLSAEDEEGLGKLFETLDAGGQGQLARLATRLGSKSLDQYASQIVDRLMEQFEDTSASTDERIAAVRQAIQFRVDNEDFILEVLEQVTPQMPPEVASATVSALARSGSETAAEELVALLPSFTPASKTAAIAGLLSRPTSTNLLLDAIDAGDLPLSDLALDQRQQLASHPDREIRRRAAETLRRGGALPNENRQRVLEQFASTTTAEGDAVRGKAVFLQHCSKCHVHSGEGVAVGPELTGMAAHPKAELLIHILDPNRSVEGNFRLYNVLLTSGEVLSGMLASESRTAIELVDAAANRRSVLREDIEELKASRMSLMPEGFESSIKPEQMTDLLTFLAARGRFTPVDLRAAATAPSDRSLFANADNPAERLVLDSWATKTFAGVPFSLVDPAGGRVNNVIVLNSPNGAIANRMPRQVELPVGAPAVAIHMLGGVAGWGHPYGEAKTVALLVRIHYASGEQEEHELLNGVHFADYIRRVDVPESQYAFDTGGGQIRYLAVRPQKPNEPIEKIELIDGSEATAPVVMAITVEHPQGGHP